MRFRTLTSAIAALGIIVGGTVYLEGHENKAYLDSGGIPTICSGSIKGVKMGDYKTDAQCFDLTQTEVNEFHSLLYKYVRVPLAKETEAALVWFIYNVGETQFRNSTLLRLLNAGEYEAACHQLDRWVYVKGKRIQGLANRRAIEKEYCLAGLKTESTPRSRDRSTN